MEISKSKSKPMAKKLRCHKSCQAIKTKLTINIHWYFLSSKQDSFDSTAPSPLEDYNGYNEWRFLSIPNETWNKTFK